MRAKPCVYVASKLSHIELWRGLATQLDITSSWVTTICTDPKKMPEFMEQLIQDIRAADYLLLYCESGEVLKGTLIEVGVALALGKYVISVGECGSLHTDFTTHPRWLRFQELPLAISWMEQRICSNAEN